MFINASYVSEYRYVANHRTVVSEWLRKLDVLNCFSGIHVQQLDMHIHLTVNGEGRVTCLETSEIRSNEHYHRY